MTIRLLQNFLTFFTIMNATICVASDTVPQGDSISNDFENDDLNAEQEGSNVSTSNSAAANPQDSSSATNPIERTVNTQNILPNNQTISPQINGQTVSIPSAQPSGSVTTPNNLINPIPVPAPEDPVKESTKAILNSSKEDLRNIQTNLGKQLQSVQKQVTGALQGKIGGIGDFVGKFLGN
jgi:hypothetical protein